MRNPRLASRYAKSLLDIAKEQGQVEQVYEDMLFMQSLIKGHRDFANLLKSPVVTIDKKDKVIEAVTAGRVSVITATFNRLLVRKGRESNLPEVITSFIQQYKVFKNIHTVKLTTAAPVSDELKNLIVEQIRKTSDIQNIDLEATVNEKLIGGFVLQAGDKLVDASIAYDLREVSRQFENNDFLYNLR